MEGIQTRVDQTSTKWDKAKKHAVNAGVTGLGLAGTVKLADKAMIYSAASINPIIRNNFVVSDLGVKVGGIINRFSEKVLSKIAGKGKFINLKSLTSFSPFPINKALPVVGALTIFTCLGILAHGIYKAGKINGEGK